MKIILLHRKSFKDARLKNILIFIDGNTQKSIRYSTYKFNS